MGFTAGYKVNEGTFWEFTVSDETIQEVVAGGGIVESDLTDYCYTALFDTRIKKLLSPMENPPWTPDWESWVQANCTCYLTNRGTMPNTAPAFNLSLLDSSDDVYQRNFLVWYGTIYPDTPNAKTGLFLVMDMFDIKRWYCDFSNAGFGLTTVTSSDLSEYQCDWPGYSGPAYTYMSNNYNFPVISAINPTAGIKESISVCNVLNVNDELWIGGYNPSTHGASTIGGSRVPYVYQQSQYRDGGYLESGATPDTLKIYQKGTVNLGAVPDYSNAPDYPDCPFQWAANLPFETWLEVLNDDMLLQMYGNWGQQNYSSAVYTYTYSYTKTLNGILKWMAWCGLKFYYNSTYYKPIIQNGIIIGFSDDMDAPSEWDDMTNVTGNNISPTPPAPGPTPGYDDDPWHGVSFSGVGVGGAGAFAKCYYMTSTELANLRSWMNSNNVPEGFDPMAQIIGLSQVPVSLSGDDNTTVQFVNSSAVYDPGVTRLVDSGVSTQISMGAPKRYSLGSVNITRRMQERGEPYLDYDCQIELYLPLIGMFSLDTQAVMGRTITAEAVLDPISGTLAAYAYVTRDGQNLPIAYGSTTIGVDLPISAQQYSVSRAALKQANAQLGTSLLSSTLSFIAAATAGGKGSGTGAKTATGSTNGLAAAGIREAGADYMKASQAGNVIGDFMQRGRTIRQLSYGNNTAVAGSFGGSTAQWSYPFTPYVKIIRPRYEKPRNYKHSQGVPCVQTKTVGSCTGFIQCIGVDVSGITGATDIELQAIQAALTNGVFAGGGS